MRRLKVEGYDGLERDIESGGIVNTDRDAYNIFLEKQKQKESKEKRLNTIEKDMSELKGLLKELLNQG